MKNAFYVKNGFQASENKKRCRKRAIVPYSGPPLVAYNGLSVTFYFILKSRIVPRIAGKYQLSIKHQI